MNVAHCHNCGGSLAEYLPSVIDAQTREVFGIQRCESCQLGHTLPQPEDLGRHYGEQYYGARHRFTKDWRMGKRWDRVVSSFAEYGAKRKIENVLDVGCGDGTFLELAAAQGAKAVGVEFGDNARRLREMGLNVFELIEDLPENEKFDVITLWNSLEHVREPKATLAAVRRLIRDDGVIIVAVPDAGGLQARTFGSEWFHLDVPRHLFHFTQSALTNMLDREGFTTERWIHTELEQDVFGWLQSSLNKVFPRPNILYYALTGTLTGVASSTVALSYAASAMIGPLTVPAIAMEVATRNGATMTVVGRPKKRLEA